MSPCVVLKEYLPRLEKTWWQGDFENLSCQIFWWTGKYLKVQPLVRLLWTEKNLEAYTAQDQHLKIKILNLWMNWEKLCPNLSSTVENKMENSRKKQDGYILKLTYSII